tara:strand:+ start:918 stop:1394 length:477 start_codon:yes stop_codon:yes gene_type:complete
LIKIKKLKQIDLKSCLNLVYNEKDNFSDLKFIGWSKKQIISQFSKSIDYSLGIYKDNNLISFMLGDLISIEKDAEYEILVLYVKKSERREGFASKLLKYIEKQKKNLNLKKIYLEVSKNNNNAIYLYKKNKYNLINIRKNYYLIKNQKIDSLCYVKLL